MSEFQNKVALVTGASTGIGRATAVAFAREGAKVVVADVNEEGAKETLQMIEDEGGEAIFVPCDVSKPADLEAAVSAAVRTYGGLHCAVNNAGIAGASAPTADYGIEDWQQVIDINLSGVFYSMKYEIPAMIESGGGAIVNMSSILGAVGIANSVAYVTAKHGVVGMTKTTAMEYAEAGIRVNAVGPGFIVTPMVEPAAEDPDMAAFMRSAPMGRMGTPEEVAALTLFLCSDRASFCTGAYYPVDGGWLAR